MTLLPFRRARLPGLGSQHSGRKGFYLEGGSELGELSQRTELHPPVPSTLLGITPPPPVASLALVAIGSNQIVGVREGGSNVGEIRL